jgi:outer membrane lipoprotein-sorting protein
MNRVSPRLARRRLRKAVAGLLLVLLAALAPYIGLHGAGLDARAIMQSVYQQDTSRDATFRAEFDVFDKDNHSAKKRFLYRRLGSLGSSKVLVVFSDPQQVRGVALLSITQPGSPARQYIYTPAIRRVRDVAPQERSAPFIGTDFTYEDISEHALDDFSYKLINESETMEDHKVYKVQAAPVDLGRSQYKFVYYWVAQDVPVILHAEMYDSQGREIRMLHATDLKHVSGIWGARHVEMASAQGGTRTVLTIDEVKFNTGLDAKLFTPENLEGTR